MVDTSASGAFEPSFVRKIGSSPPVASNLARTNAGVIENPVEGSWQLTQERPFVPRLWKNGLLVSMPPFSEKVRAVPPTFGNGRRFGSPVPASARLAASRTPAVTVIRQIRPVIIFFLVVVVERRGGSGRPPPGGPRGLARHHHQRDRRSPG